MQARNLVVEAAVPAVLGEAFDDRIDHLDAGLTGGCLKALLIGQDRAFQPLEEAELRGSRVSGPSRTCEQLRIELRVLHVDREKRRAFRDDLALAVGAARRIHGW